MAVSDFPQKQRGDQSLQAQAEVSRSSAPDYEELTLNYTEKKGEKTKIRPCLDSRGVIHKVSAFINLFPLLGEIISHRNPWH